MNKTVYLREDEVSVWERAKELAGDRLSPVIVSALKRYIAENKPRPDGYDRIVVRYNDPDNLNLPKAKAFYGKWLIKPEEKWGYFHDEIDGLQSCFAVAVSMKGSVVVYSWKDYKSERSNELFEVYENFQAAAAKSANGAVVEAMARYGVTVEELDI